jgi:hypothetical protein
VFGRTVVEEYERSTRRRKEYNRVKTVEGSAVEC